MSLGRLLTAGKCLMGLQNPPVRYHMRSKSLLPKFGGDKNPFASPASAPAPEPARTTAPAAGQVARYQRSTTELAAARLTETKKLPATMPLKMKALLVDTPAPATPEPAAPAARAGWLTETWQKWNPLARLARRESKPKSAIPRFTKPQIQGELSLDNIRVVRNDLSDADVEIVPAKLPAGKVNPTNPARPAPAVPVEGTLELIKTC